MARRAARQTTKVTETLTATPAPVHKLRAVARPNKAATSRGTSSPKLDLDGLSAEQKVAILLRERDKLITQLEAVQAKALALEARDAQLVDRIAWALDTLNDLLRETG